MNCLLPKTITNQHTSLSSQLETIQEDLVRLSGFISQLWGLTEEQLAACEISEQLDSIHRCLNRFEARCLTIQVAAYEDEFPAPVDDESYEMTFPENNNWTTVRREVKRANKLANQLTGSHSKIRACLGEYQNPGVIPEDIVRINQTAGNAVSGLASDYLLDHG